MLMSSKWDAASKTGIDDVREIIESVRYRPITARYKVYIIDEVHMLSKQAFNALLKTLEEPPEHVKFVFATTEIRKVPVTVLSRCQRFDLRRLDAAALSAHFNTICEREKVTADPEALNMIARAAEGSVRDGLSLLDQAIAYGGDHVKADDVNAMLGLVDQARIIDLFEAVMNGDAASALKQIEEQYAAGADPHTIITDLAQFVHWVTRLKIVPDDDGRSGRTEAERKRGAELAGKLAMPHLTIAWQLLLKGLQEVAVSANPLMAAEMVIIRLAHAATLPSPADLVERLQNAPQRTTAGNGAEAQAPSPPPMTARPVPDTPSDSAQPQMHSASSAMPAPATSGSAAVAEAAQPQLASFADVVALAGERRDIKLKAQLETFVRPVSMAAGKIEIALEDKAPPGLPGELGRKLEAWTGSRWMVLVSKSQGEKPLAVQKREREASLFEEARRNPHVRAVLDAFPGAEIVNVEQLDTPDMDVVIDEDTSE